MNCPDCGRELPVGRSFCSGCGARLDFGDAAIQGQMSEELRREAQEAFVRRTGAWLATSLALLAAAWAFRSMYRERDIPAFQEAPVVEWIGMDPDRALPLPEVPPLDLPVPGGGAP